MRFTVLGASGFIGSNLRDYLTRLGHECFDPTRDDPVIFSEKLGHVIYCAGLTADFRQKPFDTVRAHVCHLVDVLERSDFDSLLYLSSTRVYGNSGSTEEDVVLLADPQNPGDLYNLTKLTGEALCFSCGKRNVRVARLSNVYGNDFSSENFLCSIIRDAVRDRRIVLRTTPDSAKDYIAIHDVMRILPRVALSGRRRIYNVASGINISNRALLDELARLCGCAVSVADEASTIVFPLIDIRRIREEFAFQPSSVLSNLADLVRQYQEMINDKD